MPLAAAASARQMLDRTQLVKRLRLSEWHAERAARRDVSGYLQEGMGQPSRQGS